MAAAGTVAIVRLFAQSNYRLYTIGNVSSLLGSWAQRIAVAWLVWELTQSPVWVGILAFADLFPTVLLAPIAGAAADRFDQMRLMVTLQILGSIQALLVLACAISGVFDVWLLIVLAMAAGIANAFEQPIRMSLVTLLVPRENIGTAVALNATIFSMARFLGPLVAGLAIATAGVEAVFVINALSYGLFAILLARVVPVAHERTVKSTSGLLSDAVSGLRYVRAHYGLGSMLLILTGTSFFLRPVMEMLPPFSSGVVLFGVPLLGPDGLVLLTSVLGFGAVTGGLFLAWRGVDGLTDTTLKASILAALSLLVFLVVPGWPLRLVALAVTGASLVVAQSATQTLVQLYAAPEMRGRVLSLHGMIFRGAPAVGALLLGALSERLGLEASFAAGAAVALIFCGWGWWRRLQIAGELDRRPLDTVRIIV